MANPNFLNITTINGKTIGAQLTTVLTNVLLNPASSGKIFKINSISVANITGSAATSATVSIYKNQSTNYYLAHTIVVPADATLVVASKDMSLYLEENDAISAGAGDTGYAQIIISYEEIS